MKKGLFVIGLLLLAGCAGMNPFCQFYQDKNGGIDISTNPNVILPTGEPKIYSGGDKDADHQKMLEDGYRFLGFASFNSGNVSKSQMIAQAKQVKAEVVIFYSQYTNTISGITPLTLPDTQTVTGFTSGNIHGSRGSASYSGSSTATIYGTKTTYIPYSENRYDYLATFWIKMKKTVFGAALNDLSSELREKIGSNKGALVIAVVQGSPAFMADVLKGDILRKINDTEIIDGKTFVDSLPQFVGQTVSIELLRDGKSITKQIKLNTSE